MTRVKPVFIFDATTTTLTQTLMESGFAELVNVVMPNFTNGVTATVTVKDVDGYTVWTKATISENATTLYGNGPDAARTGMIPLDYGHTVTVELSGAAGGTGGTVAVVFYCKSSEE
jgi:hypothetical protein